MNNIMALCFAQLLPELLYLSTSLVFMLVVMSDLCRFFSKTIAAPVDLLSLLIHLGSNHSMDTNTR